jgi:Kef-type K+ transport system membrane component KefB
VSRLAGLVVLVSLMLLVRLVLGDHASLPGVRSSMSFGFLLLAAYLSGDLLARWRLPRITGYILAGVAFGPQLSGLVGADTVSELKLIDDLALSFIALAAGGELRLAELRERSRSIAWTVACQALLVIVGIALFVLAARPLLPFLDGRSFAEVLAVAGLLGAFAAARSPASAIAIISECRARGPFTEMVLGATVLMDVLVIIVFALFVAAGQSLVTPGARLDLGFVGVVLLELAGSVAAGLTVGWLVSRYIELVRAELVVFVLGVAFGVTLFAHEFALLLERLAHVSLHLEPMLVCVTAGLYVRNVSRAGDHLMESIEHGALPIYVVFFSLTGAALDLEALQQTGLAALALVGVRAALVWAGGAIGGRLAGDPASFVRWSGWSFLTQAGVSLGLAGIVMRRFPEWGGELATLIVAVVALNQLAGPVALKFALQGVGEARVSSPGRRRR